jgi:O-antigen/teichoic acid export membrane protein
LFSGNNSILNGIQNAARQRTIVALHQGMETWARFLAAAGLMLFLGATSTVAMVGYSVGIVLVLGSQYAFFRKIVPGNVDEAGRGRSWSEQIWKYSWPFASWGIFNYQQASDRWALGLFASTKRWVCMQLFQLILPDVDGFDGDAVLALFSTTCRDARSKRNADDQPELASNRIVARESRAQPPGGYSLHAQIFRIFVAKEYAAVSHLLPWMLLAGGVLASGQTIALNLMSQMKTQSMAVAKIITALIGVILNFAGAYWYGTAGIVIASVLFSVLYFFWMALLSKTAVEVPVCAPRIGI